MFQWCIITFKSQATKTHKRFLIEIQSWFYGHCNLQTKTFLFFLDHETINQSCLLNELNRILIFLILSMYLIYLIILLFIGLYQKAKDKKINFKILPGLNLSSMNCFEGFNYQNWRKKLEQNINFKSLNIAGV